MIKDQVQRKEALDYVENLRHESRPQSPSSQQFSRPSRPMPLSSVTALPPSQSNFFRNNSGQRTRPQQSLTFTSRQQQPQHTQQKQQFFRKPCLFCSTNSPASNACTQFGTKPQREQKLCELGRCTNCLRHGHENCLEAQTCVACRGSHNIVFCPTRMKPLPLPQVNFSNDSEPVSNPASGKHSQVLLKCIKATVFNPANPKVAAEALIFLDDGSTSSYIKSDLVKRLNCSTIDRKLLQISTFYDQKPKEAIVESVDVGIKLVDNSTFVINGHAVRHLTHALPYAEVGDVSLLATSVIKCDWNEPDILIGSDCYHEFAVTPAYVHSSGYQVLSSKLGTLIGGRGKTSTTHPSLAAPSNNVIFTLSSIHSSRDVLNSIDNAAKRFFSLETLGITDEPEASIHLKNFCESIKLINGRYEVPLPWKNYPPPIPTNFGLSYGRLRSVLKNLHSRPEILQKYHDIVLEHLKLGIIEKAPIQTKNVLHYLPHQPVVREDKGKVRIVYDASAKTVREKCINDCLEQGPLLLQNMTGVILRFRTAPIVVACDIEKAFLQVSVAPRDRDALRFLWVQDPSLPPENSNLIIYRLKRVTIGLTCSPFLLAITLAHHFQIHDTPLARELEPNIYVDNILITATTVEDARQKGDGVKRLLNLAGMNVREFVSNQAAAIEHFAEEDRLVGQVQKFLGIPWDTNSDDLIISLPTLPCPSKITKRVVLSALATLFDPLGLVSPILVPGKILIQNMWQKKLDWDDEVDAADAKRWCGIVADWVDTQISIPRPVCLSSSDSALHIFTDASVEAFGCCAFLVPSNSQFRPSLIFAKTKIRPAKCIASFSIHKMELLGVLIGTRVAKFCLEQLRKSKNLEFSVSNSLTLWTDSTTVLHWLRSASDQETFVENRLRAIRAVPNLTCRYVPTSSNPADIASRGCTPGELKDSPLWWNGPPWLSHAESTWPELENITPYTALPHTVSVAVSILPDPLINVSRFSSWLKLVRSTSYVLRFLRKLTVGVARFQAHFPKLPHPFTKFPSITELRAAQLYLFHMAQATDPPDDAVRENLGLFTDGDGLLRLRGRLTNSAAKYDAKFPIYLPPRSRITELWIYVTHLAYSHTGATQTLALARQKVWIPQGRRNVRSIIRRHCLACRKLTAPPFQLPQPPPFPVNRVVQAVPFENCGLDYFGPINVKENRRPQKIWVCLFTCMVVRAIHMEVVQSLSASDCISAIRRFMARRGIPKVFFSDNGTQFVLTSKVIEERFHENWKNATQHETFQSYLASHGIRWVFITERAPWRGGFYERLIGIVKEHMKRVLGRCFVSTLGIITIMSELESVVNSRPISYSSDDPKNPSPIRPIDFLLLHNRHKTFYPISPTSNLGPPATSQDTLLQYWKFASQKIDYFWKEWYSDYLLALRERERRIRNSSICRPPKAGELVLVFDDTHPRTQWKTAVVVAGEPSEDGAIRTATIRLPSGHVTRRAINLLFPLETADDM